MSDAGLVVDGRGLSKWFGDVTALDQVDLAVRAGEVHGLVGANGAGKSTLLSALLGLVVPDEGTVRLFGRTRREAGSQWLDGVGGFIEAPAFYPYLSGRRNLAVLERLDENSSPDVEGLIEQVGLTDAAGRKVRGYSLGMRQRLGLASALLRRPKLLVVDEPTNGLDPAGARELRDLLSRLAHAGVAVLLSSHDMRQVSELCSTVTVLDRGRVVFSGGMDQARAEAPDPSWRMLTSNDTAATGLARGFTGVSVTVDEEDGLRVVAARAQLDTYVIGLGRAGVAVRGLTEDVTALEALFFRLTEQPSHPGPTASGSAA